MLSEQSQQSEPFEVIDDKEEDSTQSSGRDSQPLESRHPLDEFIATTFATLPATCECPPKIILEKECSCRDDLENETNTVKISIESFRTREYKPERIKTLLTVLCFLIVMLINHFVLAVISDIISRIPLPDLTHSLIKQYDTPRHLSDIFASAALVLLFIIIIVFHKHRWIVSRRLFYIATVLYIMRAVSICLTHIPASFSAETDICVPPNPDPYPSFESVYSKFLSIVTTMGLQVQAHDNKIHCGDMLFSGHATAISISCFFLNYYTPHSMWPLKLAAITSCIFAMICMVVSRIHYSVDVVMGYWISSIIFSVYHGFCEVPHVLRPRNRPFRRLFIFWTMYELEHNVPEGRIPNELEWPLPWPQMFVDKFEEWNRKSNKSITGKIALWLTDHRIKLHF
ncbi:unnamed protein product [Cylicocyclus nassatus]|uniref:Sphingomyelin synthase-like domain-containing protein n=1 Tax=Cylicocyclus nassatus TaxID=53992 RepID=A0AA36HDI0_CYLNA|nr:unnamed protein product [Cylicocyclus nassatus]